MLTAGVRPAAAVRSVWASNAGHSTAPSAVWGSRIADMPVIVRPGRIGGVAPIPTLLAPLGRDILTADDADHRARPLPGPRPVHRRRPGPARRGRHAARPRADRLVGRSARFGPVGRGR